MSDLHGTDVDLPEPEDVFAGPRVYTEDHKPTDADDRDVELREPEDHEPQIDLDDRDAAQRQ